MNRRDAFYPDSYVKRMLRGKEGLLAVQASMEKGDPLSSVDGRQLGATRRAEGWPGAAKGRQPLKNGTLHTGIAVALAAALGGMTSLASAQEAPREAEPVVEGREDVAEAPFQGSSMQLRDADQHPAGMAVELETVTVTGTRIRGGETPSPVISIDAQQIRAEGFTDLGEVIRSLPQNFGGGQNPGVAAGATLGAAGGANQNITGGSALNLRGLGPDASLTLLNGRRLAYSGFSQAVDISAIPVEAVERVEIVADGASAIYGSDAVGGVGNVVLKRGFQGMTASARYGKATGGGRATREYSATTGAAWPSGGVIATFQDVSADPVYASERDFTEFMDAPTTIYPASDSRSGLLSAHQTLGESLELRLDALGMKREQASYYIWNGINRLSPETTTTLLAPSVDMMLPGDWSITAGAAWGKDRHTQYQQRQGPGSEVPMLLLHGCYCNESRSYEIGAEGPLFAVWDGAARLAVGAGYRTNRYEQPNYITGGTDANGDESATFAYAELNIPLIGPGRDASGAQRLEFTAAIRGEDYDSFGSVATPKLGLIYAPNKDFTLKGSWGRSFKAPSLMQRYYDHIAILDIPQNYGATGHPDHATVLLTGGGNLELDPERARTWTASIAYHPEAAPRLGLELTWFNIDYTDRVIQPITDYASALTNPQYAEFIDRSPSADDLAEAIAAAQAFYNVTGAPYDPSNVVAIIRSEEVNAVRQQVKGVDLSGHYKVALGPGNLTIRGAGSWLDITQETAGLPRPYGLSGTTYNPATVNGRVGAVWDRGGFTVSAFANYTSGVTNTLDGRKTASFTTVDTTLRYQMTRLDDARSGVEVALSIQNILNRAPPLHAAAALGTRQVPPYDSTNYSAIGRMVSLSVSKHW